VPFDKSTIGNFVKYDATTNTCSVPKEFELYVFYFPVQYDGDEQVYYEIESMKYIAKETDTELSKTQPNSIEIKVLFVDITEQNLLNDGKAYQSFFPDIIGSIFAPLFEE